ncbi:MAG: hypothetical protein QME79_14315 [Bacillota bacterium]|nr:hypothetical protein [Bacillota bacterium]
MRRLLSPVVILITLGCMSAVVQAVPRPSWDWTIIESIPKPDDPAAYEDQMRAKNSVLVELDAQEAFIRFSSYATLWTPTVARAWLFRYADNNLLSDEEMAEQWSKEKTALSESLQFQLYLIATEYEYATLTSGRSKINNVILIDDKGHRFAPIRKYSAEPKFDTYGGSVGAKVFSTVTFPLADPAGNPVISDTTRYLDLYLTTNVGKAKFHFEFDDPDRIAAGPQDENSGDAGEGFRYRNVVWDLSAQQVSGEIENQTDQGYDWATFRILVHRSSGGLVAIKDVTLGTVGPHSTVPFTATFSSKLPGLLTYRIEFQRGQPSQVNDAT